MEKIDLDSKHFSDLERPTDGQFLKRYVDQIQKARTSLFDEMVTEIAPNHDTYQMIQKRYMMVRKNVTKEKLSEWLQTACLILDQFCLPSLQNAATIVDSLRTEKSSDQQRIIDLQNQVINKQEEQLNSVKRTVETEMKTYSAAVTKSCAAALAPKRIEAAVKKATDRDDRSRNVVLYGVSEVINEPVQKSIEKVLCNIGEKPMIQDACRLGSKKTDKPRPIKFSLSSTDHVNQVLRNAKKLRLVESYMGMLSGGA